MRYLLALLLLVAPMQVQAGDFSGLAAGILAKHRQTIPTPVVPTPTPTPSAMCENCGGTGKLGDGTIVMVCPECKGTGKKVTNPVVPPLNIKPKPTAPAGQWMNQPTRVRVKVCNGRSCSYVWQTQNKRVWVPAATAKPAAAKLKQGTWGYYPTRGRHWSGCYSAAHLVSGMHRSQNYDMNWLRSLDWNELQSLHSDDHEGRVKRQYVVYAS